jgi:hypothetical protein
MKYLGDVYFISLGEIKIYQVKRNIWLIRWRYVEVVLHRFNMMACKHVVFLLHWCNQNHHGIPNQFNGWMVSTQPTT